MQLSTERIEKEDPEYPSRLREHLGEHAPPYIAVSCNMALLARKLLALFCSTKCPGRLILETYDLAHKLRQAEFAIVSGFHTPVERECLNVLLRGPAPVIICPA